MLNDRNQNNINNQSEITNRGAYSQEDMNRLLMLNHELTLKHGSILSAAERKIEMLQNALNIANQNFKASQKVSADLARLLLSGQNISAEVKALLPTAVPAQTQNQEQKPESNTIKQLNNTNSQLQALVRLQAKAIRRLQTGHDSVDQDQSLKFIMENLLEVANENQSKRQKRDKEIENFHSEIKRVSLRNKELEQELQQAKTIKQAESLNIKSGNLKRHRSQYLTVPESQQGFFNNNNNNNAIPTSTISLNERSMTAVTASTNGDDELDFLNTIIEVPSIGRLDNIEENNNNNNNSNNFSI